MEDGAEARIAAEHGVVRGVGRRMGRANKGVEADSSCSCGSSVASNTSSSWTGIRAVASAERDHGGPLL